MVGGTIPPRSDSGEISRVLVLNLLWQSKRCSHTAQDISVLTTPSLLSRGTRRGSHFGNRGFSLPHCRSSRYFRVVGRFTEDEEIQKGESPHFAHMGCMAPKRERDQDST